MTFDLNRRCVKDEMSKNVVSIAATEPLVDAIDRMEEHSLSALPVVDSEGRCIGMISATDVARSARETAIHLKKLGQACGAQRQSLVSDLTQNGILNQTVHDVMRYKLKCVHEDTPVAKAGSKMLWSRFHHLPVVDDDQQLVGIVSTLDILAAFVKQARSENDSSQSSSGTSPEETLLGTTLPNVTQKNDPT